MALHLMIVFVLLPALGQGLGKGDSCINQLGDMATCTNIRSCKATIDALSKANGAKIYVAGKVCGDDLTEPLVCCKTIADASANSIALSGNDTVPGTIGQPLNVDSTSVDLDIFTNLSVLSSLAKPPVVFELPTNDISPADVNISGDLNISENSNISVAESTTVSADISILPNNEPVTTGTTMSTGIVIFTSPPLVQTTSEPPTLFSVSSDGANSNRVDGTTSTPLVPLESSDVPDVLPLESNSTTTKSPVEPVLSRFPDQPVLPISTSNEITEIPKSPPTDTSATLFFNTFTEPPISSKIPPKPSINKFLPDRNVCGFQNPRRRMPDAPISTIDEFPWVALLKYQYGYGYDAGFRCTGTLISNRYVITAAHCVVTEPDMFYLTCVRLGEWLISSSTDCVPNYQGKECMDKVVEVGIEKKIPHPGYDPSCGRNDVALLRLERNVDFTVFIRPICLPVENLREPPAGTILTTAGWGATKYGCELDIKSKIHIPVLPKDKCSNSYTRVFDDQICLGTITKDDFCRADSGGPVMAIDVEDKSQWYLEGVISEGFSCGWRAFPGVYTRVTKHVEWILSTIEKDTL